MRKVAVVGAIVVCVAAVALGMAGVVVWQRLHEPFKGFSENEQLIEIPAGAGAAAIARQLAGAGLVRDEFTFRAALWWTGRSRALQAGEYRFEGPASAIDVVDRLSRGDVYARRLTIPEGLTILEMSRLYESQGFGKAADFVAAAGDASPIRDMDPGAPDLEGYLFPETYALTRDTSAARLVGEMVRRFRATYDGELRRSAEAQGFSTRDFVTLASIIEKETGKADERPLVAAVYRNRLKIGMGLQADPTVVYAMQKAGTYDGNIRRQDLSLDSPYNTYRYPGLPPGPIAAPGAASLAAAARPAAAGYLYFVSRNDGSHAFADTLAEHNRNVREFQILGRRRQAAGAQ